MTQEERRTGLIRMMQQEMPQYRGILIPEDREGQENLLRSLMNVRPPIPAKQEFLEMQDAYLSEECRKRGFVDGSMLPETKPGSRMSLWQGDITCLKAGAIVNAANSSLLGCFRPLHSCIDNIIHTRAGIQLRLCCDQIMKAQGHEEPVGCAKLTPAYNLPSRYVIHTVGPVVTGTLTKADCGLLSSCYRSCLETAVQNQIKTVAFCCISTGVFRFPLERAAEIAVETVSGFLEQDHVLKRVIFDVFTDRDYEVYGRLLESGPEKRTD